jgi:AcrR family transcriptional regulator
MARPAAPSASRDRLLAAAREEFAARGFDGATVDRIAARARVNKAMLYYHFRDKAALYREILRDLFRGVADGVHAVRGAGGPADAQLERFVETIAREGIARPGFPAIWLREMADGGRHVDAPVVAEMRRVLEALAGLLADGERAGAFRRANPFITHVGIVGPLLLFAASAPARRRLRELGPADVEPPPAALLAHVQQTTLAALRPAAPARARRRPVSRRRP